ncbi:MAG TPA: DUF2605 domain-containing protein [Trichocoleus sp.]|jgi:hypothetical protein
MFSPDSNSSDPEFLKTLLHPLLEDFQYWFARSQTLLENEAIDFLGDDLQADLLARIQQAQQEVSTAQMLLKLTDGQVGLETSILMPWHQLVTECWQVGMRHRMQRSTPDSSQNLRD